MTLFSKPSSHPMAMKLRLYSEYRSNFIANVIRIFKPLFQFDDPSLISFSFHNEPKLISFGIKYYQLKKL